MASRCRPRAGPLNRGSPRPESPAGGWPADVMRVCSSDTDRDGCPPQPPGGWCAAGGARRLKLACGVAEVLGWSVMLEGALMKNRANEMKRCWSYRSAWGGRFDLVWFSLGGLVGWVGGWCNGWCTLSNHQRRQPASAGVPSSLHTLMRWGMCMTSSTASGCRSKWCASSDTSSQLSPWMLIHLTCRGLQWTWFAQFRMRDWGWRDWSVRVMAGWSRPAHLGPLWPRARQQRGQHGV
jgi:hypothetical protein